MVKGNNETTKNDITKLERSLRKLNSALAEHLNCLEKHATAMENLTQAMKQLDSTFEKDSKLESHQPSLQLKEAVSSFVDFHINPRYYHDKDLLQIKAASLSEAAPQFNVTSPIMDKVPSNVNRKKVDDTIDQVTDNLYILALKKAIKDFKEQT